MWLNTTYYPKITLDYKYLFILYLASHSYVSILKPKARIKIYLQSIKRINP